MNQLQLDEPKPWCVAQYNLRRADSQRGVLVT